MRTCKQRCDSEQTQRKIPIPAKYLSALLPGESWLRDCPTHFDFSTSGAPRDKMPLPIRIKLEPFLRTYKKRNAKQPYNVPLKNIRRRPLIILARFENSTAAQLCESAPRANSVWVAPSICSYLPLIERAMERSFSGRAALVAFPPPGIFFDFASSRVSMRRSESQIETDGFIYRRRWAIRTVFKTVSAGFYTARERAFIRANGS